MTRYLAVKQETTYHAGGTPDIFLEVGEANFESDQGFIEVPTLQSRTASQVKLGKFSTDISFGGAIDPSDFGYILKFTCGTVSTSGTAPPYTHTFIPVNSPSIISFVAERNLEDITAERVNGCVVDSLEVSLEVGGLAEYSVDGYGGKKALVDARTPSFGTLNPFAFWEGQVQLAGTTIATVKSLTLTLDNDVQWDDSWVIRATDGRFPRKVFTGRKTVDLDMELQFEDTSALKRFFDGANATEPGGTYTPFSMQIKLSNSGGTLTIDLPKVYFEADNIDLSDLELLTQSITAHGLHDPSIGGAVKFTLQNSKPSY